MVSVCSTWLKASHRITGAFPGQAFVLHPAKKNRHDKVTVIISHGFMRAHRWIWLGWIGNQKSISGWLLFLPKIDFSLLAAFRKCSARCDELSNVKKQARIKSSSYSIVLNTWKYLKWNMRTNHTFSILCPLFFFFFFLLNLRHLFFLIVC